MPSKEEGWLLTCGGKVFRPRTATHMDIHIHDTALALSRIVRFGGHYKREIGHYSVAEHCALCMHIVIARYPDEYVLPIAALFHDFHEPLTGFCDTCGNMKCWAPAIGATEDRVDELVARAIGISPAIFHHPAVKEADLIALDTERRFIMPKSEEEVPWPDCNIQYEPPWELGMKQGLAEQFFLRSYYQAKRLLRYADTASNPGSVSIISEGSDNPSQDRGERDSD